MSGAIGNVNKYLVLGGIVDNIINQRLHIYYDCTKEFNTATISETERYVHSPPKFKLCI